MWVGHSSDWEKTAGNSLLSQCPLGSLPCFRGHSLIQAGEVWELGLSPGSGEEGCRASLALWSLRWWGVSGHRYVLGWLKLEQHPDSAVRKGGLSSRVRRKVE